MRHILLCFVFLTTSAFGSEIPEPRCVLTADAHELWPDQIIRYEDLTREEFEGAIKDLKAFPDEVEQRALWVRENIKDRPNATIFEGNLYLWFPITVMTIEAYTLKLEYLAAPEAERAEAEYKFCEYVRTHHYPD